MKTVLILLTVLVFFQAWAGSLYAQDMIVQGDGGVVEEKTEADKPVFNYEKMEKKQLWQANPVAKKKGEAKLGQEPRSAWGVVLQLLGGILVLSAIGAGCLFLFKKIMPGGNQFFSTPATEVLGRTYLDSKRYIALVRVGHKILVLGVSPEEMNCLSEVTDEAEMADIMRQARPKTESGKSMFKTLLEGKFTNNNESVKSDNGGDVAMLTGEIAAIQDKLKKMRV